MIYPGQGLPPPANSSATMLLADLGGMSTAQGAGYPQPGPGHLALDKTVSAAPHNPLITLATAICAIHWWRWLGPASHQFLPVCSGSQTACSGRSAVCSLTLLEVCSVTLLARPDSRTPDCSSRKVVSVCQRGRDMCDGD